jgi:hypothetical protein
MRAQLVRHATVSSSKSVGAPGSRLAKVVHVLVHAGSLGNWAVSPVSERAPAPYAPVGNDPSEGRV